MSEEQPHEDAEAVENPVCMLLVKGESPDDKPIYAYVAVPADRLEAFMQAQEGDALFHPDEYGTIVEAG
ncbi:MAG: hypothetical protein ACPG80_05660, partial [Rickettsiales bacterium]